MLHLPRGSRARRADASGGHSPGYETRKDIAGMGNYNYFLTVQKLVDVVALLRTLSEDPSK
jgi:hypothetical protein